ncbi:MAG: hypothetical protein ACSHW0_03885 [Thalassotalea sp.]
MKTLALALLSMSISTTTVADEVVVKNEMSKTDQFVFESSAKVNHEIKQQLKADIRSSINVFYLSTNHLLAEQKQQQLNKKLLLVTKVE